MDFSYYRLCVLLLLLPVISGQEVTEAASVDVTAGNEVAAVEEAQTVEVSISTRDEISIKEGAGLSVKCSMTPEPGKDALKWYFEAEGQPRMEVKGKGEGDLDGVYVREQGSIQKLTVSKMTSDMEGTYTCEGEANGQKDSKSFKLTVYIAMTLKSDLEQFGYLGQNAKVECIVQAQPPASLTWAFSNDTVEEMAITSNDHFILTNEGLEIKNLQKHQEGTYHCMADQDAHNDYAEYKIKYDVVEAPVIDSPLTIDPQNAIIGQSVSIRCQTSKGDPKPTITFKRGDVDIEDSKVIDGVYTIEKLTQQDEATYMCIASNKGGMANKTRKLDVKVPTSIELAEKLEGSENQAVDLVCTAKGDPVPSITWRRGDTTYTEGVTTTDEEEINNGELKQVVSTMSLTLSHEHRGNWSCYANNGIGDEAHKQVNVEVQFAPQLDTEMKLSDYGAIGQTTVLTCVMTGNPVPTLQWKKDGEIISGNDSYILGGLISDKTHFKSTRTLSVRVGESSQFGQYVCEGQNIYNADTPVEATFELQESKKPGQASVEMVEAMTTQIKLMIKPPKGDGEAGYPVDSYKITYKKDGGELQERIEDRSGDENRVTLGNLESSSKYDITVIAVSKAGDGEAISESFNTESTSRPSIMSLIGDKEVVVEENRYTLQWEKPEDNGAPITKFTITWEKITKDGNDMNNVDGEVHTEEITDASKRDFVISELEEGSVYLVRISATNSEGESESALKEITVPAGETEEQTGASSASLGGGVIAIIIIVILLVVIIVVIIFFVARKKPQMVERLRGRGNRADEEGGVKEGGKDQAEEEKLIKKDDIKVENEVEPSPPQEEAPKEFEPEDKPEAPVEVSAEQPVEAEQPLETEIKVTGPESEEKAKDPVA